MSSEKRPRKKKNSSLGTILLIAIMVLGVGIMAYPSISDYWNQIHQSRAISSYVRAVEQMDDSQYEALWESAQAYNRELAAHPLGWELTEEELNRYKKVLDISGTGIMGYIDIPKINVELPIYHGSEETVLQIAIGHIASSSLPVGGETSHTLLTGHRGLPSARLFTDLDKMALGDVFYIRVLGEVLAYQVDDIHVVLPSDLSTLGLTPGEDYVTLITCTPYGVNTHRLLVRGRRIGFDSDQPEAAVRITSDAIRISPRLAVPAVAIPILFIALVISLFVTGKHGKNKHKHKANQMQGGRHESTEENESMEDEA